MEKLLKRFRREDDGEIAVIVACFAAMLILFMALTIDLGNTYLTHLRMRNAVDLASSAIAVNLPLADTTSNEHAMQNLAEQVAEENGIDLDEVTMTCELITDYGQIYAARVIMYREVGHYFAQLYLNRTSTIRVGDLVYISADVASASGYKITVVDS